MERWHVYLIVQTQGYRVEGYAEGSARTIVMCNNLIEAVRAARNAAKQVGARGYAVLVEREWIEL